MKIEYRNTEASSAREKTIKCLLLGDHGAGKTSLLITHVNKTFPVDYIPTVFDNYFEQVIINDTTYALAFWDTYYTDEDFAIVRALSYAQTDVFLVCLSVASPPSIQNLKTKTLSPDNWGAAYPNPDYETPGWIPEIRHHCPDIPFLLVGTKIDLREDRTVIDVLGERGQKPLSWEMGEDLAKEVGAVKYVECSAKTHEGVTNVIDEAIRAALDNRISIKQTKSSGCWIL